MTEVFISYAREDEAVARSIAAVFEAEGLAVWWDRSAIRAGEDFEEAIEAALDATESAVVLWSTGSVGSEWVRAEARRAKRRGILVPVVIDAAIVADEVSLPLSFEGRQYVDLSGWDGKTDDSAIEGLVTQVAALLPRRAELAERGPHPEVWASWDLPVVRSGEKGLHVRSLQQLLRLAGFEVDLDGIYGRGSRTTVRWFQASKHLEVDGTAGRDTWVALLVDGWFRAAAQPLLALGSKGTRVLGLQEHLVESGSRLDADAIFGPRTEAAVRHVQSDNGLEQDGVVGPDTRLALLVRQPSASSLDRLISRRSDTVRGETTPAAHLSPEDVVHRSGER